MKSEFKWTKNGSHSKASTCFVKSLFSTCLLVISLCIVHVDVNWAQGSFCGEFPPNQATGFNPENIYYDRFGNSYDLPIGVQAAPNNSIEVGFFELNIPASSFTQQEIDVITEVFSYLSQTIIQRSHFTPCWDPVGNSLIKIDFTKVLDPNNNAAAIAAASPFFYGVPFSCEPNRRPLMYSSPFRKINGIRSEENLSDGRIIVNTRYDGQLFYGYPATVPANMLDFFTVILHEAMHVVAFHPNLDGTGPLFNEYDLLLKNQNNQFYISNQCSNTCYSNTFSGCGTTCSHAVGSANVLTALNDDVAHLQMNNHVMFPGLSQGEQRRSLSQAEIQILCDLGYITSSCDNPDYGLAYNDSGSVFTSCTAYGNNDDGSELCCPNLFTFCGEGPATITFDELLCFVHSNEGISILSIENRFNYRLDFELSSNNVTVTPVTSNIVNSDFVVFYTYTNDFNQCIVFSRSYTIRFDKSCNCEFTPENECDNVLCYHTFNNLVLGSYVPYFGHPFFFENTTKCNNQSSDVALNPNFPNQGVFIGIPFQNEAVVFELNNAPYEACLLELGMQAKVTSSEATLEIWASTFPPCDINDKGISRTCGVPTTCNDGTVFQATCLGEITNITPNTFETISLLIDQASVNMPIKYIFIINKSGDISIDNIFVRVVNCAINADFTATVGPEPCNVVSVSPSVVNQHQSHLWDFGDGTTSTLANPTPHEYTTNGDFVIEHIITDNCGNSTMSNIGVNITCVEPNCIESLPSEFIRLICNNGTPLSSFINAGTIDPPIINGTVDLRNYKFAVTGKLIMDLKFSMFNTHMIFGQGAEMIVYNNASTITSSYFEGCEFLWQGITVTNFGPASSAQSVMPLGFNLNTVEDAKYGLNITNKTVVSCVSSTFDNNVIGINVENTTGFSRFTGNKFYSSNAVLLPPYVGFDLNNLLSVNNKCYAGIRLKNVPKISLLGQSNSKNIFEGIQNGLVAFNSKFDIKNAVFKNLIGIQRQGDFTRGYGIFGSQCIAANVYDNKFENLNKAVVLDGNINNLVTQVNSFNIYQNTLVNVNLDADDVSGAIEIMNCGQGAYDIYSNAFDHVAYPIRILNIKEFKNLKIRDNGTTTAPMLFRTAGIILQNCTNAGPYGIIDNNIMQTFSNGSGIVITGTDKISIMANNIKINKFGLGNNVGIRLQNSKDNEVRDNTILFTNVTATDGFFGIDINMCPNTLYCCNQITGARNNVRFTGSSTATRFRQTTLDDARDLGLQLQGSAILGSQFYADANGNPIGGYGNIWIDNVTATNTGNQFLSLFRVDNTDFPPFGTYKPTVIPATWFNSAINLPLATPNCTDDPECNEPLFQGDGPWICAVPLTIGEMEDGIDGLNTIAAYESQATWAHQTFVYDYMSRHPQLATQGPALTSLYHNPPAAVAAYHQIEHKLATLYTFTNAEVLAWQAAILSQHVSDSTINAAYAVLDAGNLGIYSPIIHTAWTNLRIQDSILATIQTAVNNRAQVKADAIKNLIQQLPLSYPFLTEYKAVRTAYVDAMLYGRSYVASQHSTIINSIADKCIGEYGRAVLWARELQSYLGLTVSEGEGDCPTVDPRSRADNADIDIHVAPNPCSGLWYVSLLGVERHSDVLFEIKDVRGFVVLRNTIKPANVVDAVLLDGSYLINGVYYLTTKVNGKLLTTKKLVKIE